MPVKRIPMWIIEKDPGGGLPTERVYSHSHRGAPLGWAILPEGMSVERFAGYMRLEATGDPPGGGLAIGRTWHVANLDDRRIVEAAVAGEFGLAWEGNGDWKGDGGPRDWFRDCLEFSRLLCPEQVGTVPAILPDDILDLRTRLIDEEYQELNVALVNDDLPGAADAMADLIYVILGTAIAMGIDLRPVWDAVQESNMAKAGGPRRADGKREKPEGWQPPDIRGVLARQGPLDSRGGADAQA